MPNEDYECGCLTFFSLMWVPPLYNIGDILNPKWVKSINVIIYKMNNMAIICHCGNIASIKCDNKFKLCNSCCTSTSCKRHLNKRKC